MSEIATQDAQEVHIPSINSRDALAAIVAAQGNLDLAAELTGTRKEFIIAAIVQDERSHDQLQRALRTFSLLKVYSLMDNLQEALAGEIAMGSIKGKDVSKAFSEVATLFASLTDDKTSTHNVNVFETVMRSLPPNVQTALQVLSGGKSDPRLGPSSNDANLDDIPEVA